MSAWPSVEDVARVQWDNSAPWVIRWDALVRDADIGGSHAKAAVAHYRARASAVPALFPTVEVVEEWHIEIPNVGMCSDEPTYPVEAVRDPVANPLAHRTVYAIESGPWAGEEDA